MKYEPLGIEVAHFPDHVTGSGIEKHMFCAEREKIRALPHFTGVDWVDGFTFRPFSVGKLVKILPVAQIARAIEQDAAALFAKTGADAEIPDIACAPEKGIAKAGQARIVGRLQDRLLPLLPGAQVGVAGSGEALSFTEIVDAIAERGLLRRRCFHAGIDNGGG